MSFDYGTGKGFTWEPRRSNADRFSGFLDPSASSAALGQIGDAYQGAQAAATDWGIARMQTESNERMARMAADQQAKQQQAKSKGGFLNGFLGLAGTAASFIPGGQVAGAALGGLGKLFG